MTETLERFEACLFSTEERGSRCGCLRSVEAFLAASSLPVEGRRRSSVGFLKRGSATDVSVGEFATVGKVLGRLQSVEASLASFTNSSVGERAAADVESVY